MATEIEHKYLVKDDSFVPQASAVIHIRQGYLSRDKERTVRVRVTDDKAFVTIKGISKGAVRPEFEYEIPRSDGELLTFIMEDFKDWSPPNLKSPMSNTPIPYPTS